MSFNKNEIAHVLRELADMIEKESVTVRQHLINITAGHVSGPDPEDPSFLRSYPDGIKDFHIEIETYDSEKDQSNKVADPVSEIRKELGY